MSTPLTLDQLNRATLDEASALLDGLYEHSPWIARAALAQRPFVTLAQLKHAMVLQVANGGRDAQLALLRAHPELAGKAMVDKSLTAESSNEQNKAGLTHCTPAEFESIQSLNAAYNAKFGFPFIVAVRGPRGTELPKAGDPNAEPDVSTGSRVHSRWSSGSAARRRHSSAGNSSACIRAPP